MRSNSFRLFALLVLTLFGHVAGQEEYTEDTLKTMSEEELEKICRIRGFEIMRDEIDPSTGLPHELSHDDYVEAARRCLAIEEEMNELLAEYPELATEIEEEIKKLEAEQSAKRAEVEKLEKELAEAEAAASTAKVSSGSAFVPPTVAMNDSGKTIAEQDDLEVIDDGDSVSHGNDNDDIMDQSAANEILEDRQEEVVNSSDSHSESVNVAVKNETAKEDFTMSAMTFEIIRAMVKQVENDVKRIVELIAPVVHPILRAGDVAWRHLKLVFESLGRTSRPTEENDEAAERTASVSA